MPTIDIEILRYDEPDRHPWPDLVDAPPDVVDPETAWRVVGLEHGMESGEPSIALRLDAVGGTVVAQTSLAAWIAATSALRGAFPEAFVGTPLEGT